MAAKRVCVIGLGNPGEKYKNTRHNIGFEWIDALSESDLFPGHLKRLHFKDKFHSLWAEAEYQDYEVHFLKPQTYMNESGRALADWRTKNQGEARVLIVYDDMDIPLGKVRLRGRGSDGGHRGLRSILELSGGLEVDRLRIGIGRPNEESIDHVLSKFKPEEKIILEKVLADAPEHFRIWMECDLEKAMSKMNGLNYGAIEGESHGS